jgi:hypothetical protein
MPEREKGNAQQFREMKYLMDDKKSLRVLATPTINSVRSRLAVSTP